jgi:DNA-binding NarL/FixJ family response regulator
MDSVDTPEQGTNWLFVVVDACRQPRTKALLETRAIIVTLPSFLRDIITTLAEASSPLSIVANLDHRSDIAAALELWAPDLVVVGLRSGETDDIGRDILSRIPTARVIAISYGGRNAYIHEMCACRRVLLDVSAEALAAAIAAPPEGI